MNIAVITRNPDEIDAYLGFGAREVERGFTSFGDHVVLLECPAEHALWQATRLGSGMHGARELNDAELVEWKKEWGYTTESPVKA